MLFISYSRRELTFVDSLSYELRQRELPFWLDYQQLTPGEDWSAQIQSAIRVSTHLLLVVSKASLNSPYVREEWELALAAGKPVILLILEAAELPRDLVARLDKVGCGWVDFRQPFATALDQLIAVVEGPFPKQTVPLMTAALPPGPARLVSTSRRVALVWSLVIVLLALTTLAYNPASTPPVLVVGGLMALPLWLVPHTIRTRTFRFAPMLATLLLAALLFPVIVIGGVLTTLVSQTKNVPWEYGAVLIPGTLLLIYWGWRALWLLGSEDIYRWAGPKGVLIRRVGGGKWYIWLVICLMLPPFSLVYGPLAYLLTRVVVHCISRATVKYRADAGVNLYVVQTQRWIAIDHAPEDSYATNVIRAEIEAAGHLSVPLSRADVILLIISTHHTTPTFDLKRAITVEGKTVIPIAIHKVPDVPPDVQALQMIELSEGMDVGTIQTIIQRIESPLAMTGLPGAFPLSQRALPTEVQYAISGLWVWLILLAATGIYALVVGEVEFLLAGLLVVMVGLIAWSTRLLQGRRPYWQWVLWSTAVLNIVTVNRLSNTYSIYALWWVALIFMPLVLAYWITTDEKIRAWLPPLDLDVLQSDLTGATSQSPLQSARRYVVQTIDEIVTDAVDFLEVGRDNAHLFDPAQVAEEEFDRCVSQAELFELFNFTPEELALNRRNDFSRRQWLFVRREAIVWVKVSLPVLVGCLVLSILLGEMHSALDLLLSLGCWGAGAVLLFAGGVLISRPTVNSTSGPIRRVAGSAGEGTPQITVGKHKLSVTRDVWTRLEIPLPGVYRVYTVRGFAVSVEPYLPQVRSSEQK